MEFSLLSASPCPKEAFVSTSLQYKSFENTKGKDELTCYEQFLHFPECFYPFAELPADFIKFKIEMGF